MRQFYRPDEVARILGISVRSVYRRIEDDTIPAIKIGRLYRISATEFHQVFPRIPRPA